MKKYDVIAVGGGASGLAACIEAARRGRSVAVAERMPRVGKKLLATGNGRCNLSNTAVSPEDYRNGAFAAHALSVYDSASTLDFFRSLGVLCVADGEGRVYPMSNTAACVLDALRFEALRLGVEFFCDTPVSRVERSGGGFSVSPSLRADRLIICAGGKASPAQGSDGSGLLLLSALGHTVTPLYPALVQLVCGGGSFRRLKGIRARASLAAFLGGRPLARARGEILFTDDGLSGIAAMDLSSHIARACGGAPCEIVIDLTPELSAHELREFFLSQASLREDSSVENVLTGAVHRRIGQLAAGLAGIDFSRGIGALSDDEIDALVLCVKELRVAVSGTRGFGCAQVTSGGVDVGEVCPLTMESKIVPGLFICGEALDVDGPCGGYNLQWAWSSGRCAGACV